jgi:hypothetical protein
METWLQDAKVETIARCMDKLWYEVNAECIKSDLGQISHRKTFEIIIKLLKLRRKKRSFLFLCTRQKRRRYGKMEATPS